MKNNSPKSDTIHRSHTFISSVGSDYPSGTPTGASAGEAEAKTILKAMSDYLAAQKTGIM